MARRFHREDAPELLIHPDHMQPIARVIERVRVAGGERAAIRVGLLPTRWKLPDDPERTEKEASFAAGFRPQVLIRAEASSAGRAEALAYELAAAWSFAGFRHAYHLTPWWRWWFDLRFDTGLFWTFHLRHLGVREIGAILKPPSMHVQSDSVERIDVQVSRGGSRLARYRGDADVVPIGVLDRAGAADDRMPRGIPVSHLTHVAIFGRAGYGKTSTALLQGLHEALRTSRGLIVIDPHSDLVEDLKRYLGDVAERVIEIDLAGNEDRPQPTWNIMARRPGEPPHVRVRVIRDALAVALGWQGSYRRLLAVATLSARTLVDLADQLPPELAPTLFDLLPLLTDEDWRAVVLAMLSPRLQRAWAAPIPKEAIGSIAAAVSDLRESPAACALFGASVSTFDPRAAMDEGRIVLVRPGRGNTLAAALLFQGFVAAALSRQDTAPERRRPARMIADELPAYAAGLGPILGVLLAETRKYRLYLTAIAQSPDQLPGRLLLDVLTNCSASFTFKLNSIAANLLAREWGGTPSAAAISRLPKHVAYADLELGLARGRPIPFRIRTIRPEDLFRDFYRPELLEGLERALDATTGRRPPEDVEEEADARPEAILAALGRPRTPEEPPERSGPPEGFPAVSVAPTAWERARGILPDLPESPADLEREGRKWAVSRLRERGWSLRQLAEAFQASVSTVRRDLGLLDGEARADDREAGRGQ